MEQTALPTSTSERIFASPHANEFYMIVLT